MFLAIGSPARAAAATGDMGKMLSGFRRFLLKRKFKKLIRHFTEIVYTADEEPVCANQVTPALYEEVIRRNEGVIAADGPLVVLTGHHIGRSSNDKS